MGLRFAALQNGTLCGAFALFAGLDRAGVGEASLVCMNPRLTMSLRLRLIVLPALIVLAGLAGLAIYEVNDAKARVLAENRSSLEMGRLLAAGAIAPASVNGVITVGWFIRAISAMPSTMALSSCSGELVLMIAKQIGARVTSSSLKPVARRMISMASRVRCSVWQ